MKPKITNEYPLNELIADRWSGRAFDSKEVEEEKLKSLFEAARWAPSSYNEQPWKFLVTKKGTEAYEKLLSTLMESNQSWAKNAPVLVLTLAKTTFDRNNKLNRHAAYDLGFAIGNLSLQATEYGLNIRPMGGYSNEKVKEVFQLPEAFESYSVLSIGYRVSPQEVLNEQFAEMEYVPQSRKKQSEFLFYSEF